MSSLSLAQDTLLDMYLDSHIRPMLGQILARQRGSVRRKPSALARDDGGQLPPRPTDNASAGDKRLEVQLSQFGHAHELRRDKGVEAGPLVPLLVGLRRAGGRLDWHRLVDPELLAPVGLGRGELRFGARRRHRSFSRPRSDRVAGRYTTPTSEASEASEVAKSGRFRRGMGKTSQGWECGTTTGDGHHAGPCALCDDRPSSPAASRPSLFSPHRSHVDGQVFASLSSPHSASHPPAGFCLPGHHFVAIVRPHPRPSQDRTKAHSFPQMPFARPYRSETEANRVYDELRTCAPVASHKGVYQVLFAEFEYDATAS